MNVSPKIIERLPKYRAMLMRLHESGAHAVRSSELADALGFSAAQIRKDFSTLHMAGRKKAGYRIAALLPLINKLLGNQNMRNIIMAGVSPLGLGLAAEPFLADRRIHVAAVFGDSPAPAVRPFSELSAFVRDNAIRYAILADTGASAQRTLDRLVLSGIRNILSLSPLALKIPAGVHLVSVDLAAAFEQLAFFTEQATLPRRRP